MNPDPQALDEMSWCSLNLGKSKFTNMVHFKLTHCPLTPPVPLVVLDWQHCGLGDK